jgi:hypothetical protein
MEQPAIRDIPGASSEHRRKSRKRVLMSGVIVARRSRETFGCTVMDVSATGARLRVAPDRMIPFEFHLIVVRNRTTHRARVMWRRQQFAGVRFEETHFIDKDLPNELRFIQKIWIENATK